MVGGMANAKLSLQDFKQIAGLEHLTDEQAEKIKNDLTCIINTLLNGFLKNAK